MNEILCKRLVEAREKAGYTRKALCEKLGIPYRTITNYENGSREPGSDYLVKVAKICGCTIDWLLGLQTSPGPVSSPIHLQRRPAWKNRTSPFDDDAFDDLDLNYDNDDEDEDSNEAENDGDVSLNENLGRPNTAPIRVLDMLASKYELSHGEYVLIEKFINLKAEKRAAVVEYVLDAAAAMQSEDVSPLAPAVVDDAEAAYIKSRLDSAQNQERSASSITEDAEINDEAANQ